MDLETELVGVGKVAIAAGLGAVLGLERELARKPAGLRTHMLVSGAAALFGVVAEHMVGTFARAYGIEHLDADPIRVLQAVLVGIGFLGAGTIVHSPREPQVEGLTTAASILVAAGIGTAVAANRFVLAAGVAALTVAILVGVERVERHLAERDRREPEP